MKSPVHRRFHGRVLSATFIGAVFTLLVILCFYAYRQIERERERVLADLVSLIRFALQQESELVPFTEKVRERFAGWLLQQEQSGRRFTADQLSWLEMIRDQIATSLSMDMDVFAFVPFTQHGGVGKAFQLFGTGLPGLLDEMNEVLPR